MLNKKDYAKLAKKLIDVHREGRVMQIVFDFLANYCAEDNPKFDRMRFAEACIKRLRESGLPVPTFMLTEVDGKHFTLADKLISMTLVSAARPAATGTVLMRGIKAP